MCEKICFCAQNRSLDKAISTLGIELSEARTSQTSGQHTRQHVSNHSVQKAFVVIGINTAFSSKKRRDSIRETWLPKGMNTSRIHIPLIKVLIMVDYSLRDIKNLDFATKILKNIVFTSRSKWNSVTSNPFC